MRREWGVHRDSIQHNFIYTGSVTIKIVEKVWPLNKQEKQEQLPFTGWNLEQHQGHTWRIPHVGKWGEMPQITCHPVIVTWISKVRDAEPFLTVFHQSHIDLHLSAVHNRTRGVWGWTSHFYHNHVSVPVADIIISVFPVFFFIFYFFLILNRLDSAFKSWGWLCCVFWTQSSIHGWSTHTSEGRKGPTLKQRGQTDRSGILWMLQHKDVHKHSFIAHIEHARTRRQLRGSYQQQLRRKTFQSRSRLNSSSLRQRVWLLVLTWPPGSKLNMVWSSTALHQGWIQNC